LFVITKYEGDFGVSKITAEDVKSTSSTGGVVGTPLYCAPELLDYETEVFIIVVIICFIDLFVYR
jgi:serine/threonine protein kinase